MFKLMDMKIAFPAHSYVVGNTSLNFNVREDLRSASNQTLFIAYIEDLTYVHESSFHVLLNLLNEFGEKRKCEACRAFYYFFATSLINSIIQEHAGC